MKINLIVSGQAYNNQAAYSALQFAQCAVAAGYTISQVFFYQDGVTQANSLMVPLADEFNSVDEWVALAATQGIRLVVCISAAERRGVLNRAQQQEFEKQAHNLHASFDVQGLGAMHDACLTADRTVTFK